MMRFHNANGGFLHLGAHLQSPIRETAGFAGPLWRPWQQRVFPWAIATQVVIFANGTTAPYTRKFQVELSFVSANPARFRAE
jgi:hypothetical protein